MHVIAIDFAFVLALCFCSLYGMAPPTRKASASKNLNSKSCFCGGADTKTQVGCNLCDRMLHYGCMGDYTAAELGELINDEPGNYVCKVCLPDMSNQEADDLRKLSQDGSLWIYREAPVSVAPPSDTLGADMVQLIVQTATKAATDAAMLFMKEYLDKEKRRDNLVVVGLPELEADEISQMNEDAQKIQDYCGNLGIEPDAIQSTFREGRQRGKRVLKVCFKDRRVTELRS